MALVRLSIAVTIGIHPCGRKAVKLVLQNEQGEKDAGALLCFRFHCLRQCVGVYWNASVSLNRGRQTWASNVHSSSSCSSTQEERLIYTGNTNVCRARRVCGSWCEDRKRQIVPPGSDPHPLTRFRYLSWTCKTRTTVLYCIYQQLSLLC